MSGRAVHRYKCGSTNADEIAKNRVFHYAYTLGFDLYARYADMLKMQASSPDIYIMVTDAWGKLSAAIRTHHSGTEEFWPIPFPQCYDRCCIELFIQCPDLRDAILSGELTLHNARIICNAKGIY